MDNEAPMKNHVDGIARRLRSSDPDQLEPYDGILSRFHGLVQVPIAPLIARGQRAHRRLDPAANVGELTAFHLSAHAGGCADKAASRRSSVEAQSAQPHGTIGNGANNRCLGRERLPGQDRCPYDRKQQHTFFNPHATPLLTMISPCSTPAATPSTVLLTACVPAAPLLKDLEQCAR